MRSTHNFPALRTAVVTAAVLSVLLAGCGDKKDKKPGGSQTAAKVNKHEITVHQINYVLQQQRGLKPEQVDAVGKQVLERLIDQELAVQKAEEMKLDRDPRIVQAIEAAKRDMLARAYVEKISESASRPTAEEIRRFYDEKPALFKERRVYNIQELAIEAKPEQLATLRVKLGEAKNINEFVDYLKANDFRFAGNQVVRAADQLPMNSLDNFAKMKDGQTVLNPTPNGAQVIVLAGSRAQPIDFEQARGAIEQYLLNDRKRKMAEDDIKALRTASKVEYVGKYAAPAASVPGTAASNPASVVTAPTADAALVVPPSAAASGADADAINKGLSGLGK